MSDRPWVPHYAEGTRPEIPPIPFRHIAEMARQSAAQHASTTAFTQCMPNGMDASLTYAEVDRHSDEFAAYLRGKLGLEAGDRVAVQMPNCLAYPIVALGIFKAGCVLVNTNPLYTPPEMIHQFSDAGARVLVIIDLFADRLPPVLPKTPVETVVTVRITEFFPVLQAVLIRTVLKYVKKQLPPTTVPHTSFQDALSAGRDRLKGGVDLQGYLAGVDHGTVAALQYTGGTTGVSKGAMLTHGNLLANTAQMLEMNRMHLLPEDVIMTALPLYHIFAFTVNFLGFYQMGGGNILIPSPRPPANMRKAWEKYPITWLSGVNTLFSALLNEEWFAKNPPKHLKVSVAGGMALHEAVSRRWEEMTRTPVVEGYGLTETSPVVTFNPLGGKVKVGSIGIPIPSTDVRCADDSGNTVATGQPGELLVKGPQVMLGYWERPDETAKTIKDGWLHTGDVATMDEEGYVRIVDRMKDMVLVSGFNVYPNEVEDCIARHPGVREVAVIGVVDERTGEAVKAFVVPGTPAPTSDDIIRHCRESLAPYKVPKHIEFRDDLPKSPVGKILRKDLRPGAAAAPVQGV
ncbi:MAG TPA: AMP-binding protein [Longimicrobiaceae bacterium]|nr:AMP-binding protein [Longimicrobiaceae bacterium]